MLHNDLKRFKGKGLKSVMTKLSMITIPENALLDGVVKLLDGRATFSDTDTDVDEHIYQGHIFEDILGELSYKDETLKSYDKKVIAQLEELSKIVSQDYVLITKV